MLTIDDVRRASAVHESWKDREARRAAVLANVPAPELVARLLELELRIATLRQSLNLKQNRS